ncbi:hypothetical protein X777_02363 [Ooceraea biroi]|uniref:Uncharacterized protein n=1 Tax=Ooceraea biroi TaxID=2015173 RepID=A0A026WM64_OOCBI|nr:hypothetical protein X777_02363 [Ooceraea biroi]
MRCLFWCFWLSSIRSQGNHEFRLSRAPFLPCSFSPCRPASRTRDKTPSDRERVENEVEKRAGEEGTRQSRRSERRFALVTERRTRELIHCAHAFLLLFQADARRAAGASLQILPRSAFPRAFHPSRLSPALACTRDQSSLLSRSSSRSRALEILEIRRNTDGPFTDTETVTLEKSSSGSGSHHANESPNQRSTRSVRDRWDDRSIDRSVVRLCKPLEWRDRVTV